MQIPRFKCSFCKEEWFGFPVFKGKNRTRRLKPNEQASEVKLCPKCNEMLYQLSNGGINLISSEIKRLLSRYAADKENGAIRGLLEIQNLLFSDKDGIFSGTAVYDRFSSAEMKGRKLLNDMHISYSEQVLFQVIIPETNLLHQIRVDVLIPYKDAIGKDIVIEWDGDYYHGNPKKFKILNSIQSYNKERDTFNDELFKRYGSNYLLRRFYEEDLDNNVLSVKNRIWQAMCNTPRIPEEGQEKLDQQFKITK
jgi:hypothetical protein